MRQPRLALIAALVVVLCLPASLARAGGLGEAWEEDIEAGVERQERERKQRQPDSLLREARLLAARQADDVQRVVRLYLLARAYGIAGDVPSARGTYQEVLRLAPRCYFAYHDLAMLDLSLIPPLEAQAERSLRQAITLYPGYLTAQRKLSRLLLQQERVDEALTFLARIVDADPSDLQARYLLAQALLAAQRLDDAEREVAALVRREPHNPTFELLRGDVLARRGRYGEALSAYRRLATADPGSPAPLAAYLRCLDLQREATKTADFEGYLWALEGLLRLERDETRQTELRKAIGEIRRGQAQASQPRTEGPPTDDQLAAALPGLDPPQRLDVLRYVYAREEAPSAELLKAVIRRLSPTAEPDATARVFALRILGRFGGFGLVGLVRHSLSDPSPDVRPIAADVLVDLSRTGPPAHGAAVLVLGPLGLSDDLVLAAAARAGVQDLARAALAPVTEETEAARREAWRAWWTGPGGTEARIQALQRFPEVGDLAPEEVLEPYLVEGEDYVRLAAWRALVAAAPASLRAGDERRRAWMTTLPPAPPAEADGARANAALPTLDTWLAARPR